MPFFRGLSPEIVYFYEPGEVTESDLTKGKDWYIKNNEYVSEFHLQFPFPLTLRSATRPSLPTMRGTFSVPKPSSPSLSPTDSQAMQLIDKKDGKSSKPLRNIAKSRTVVTREY